MAGRVLIVSCHKFLQNPIRQTRFVRSSLEAGGRSVVDKLTDDDKCASTVYVYTVITSFPAFLSDNRL